MILGRLSAEPPSQHGERIAGPTRPGPARPHLDNPRRPRFRARPIPRLA